MNINTQYSEYGYSSNLQRSGNTEEPKQIEAKKPEQVQPPQEEQKNQKVEEIKEQKEENIKAENKIKQIQTYNPNGIATKTASPDTSSTQSFFA
ncbi:MAG: hypothetical protein DKM50_09060 [Candidatus Margulisiibacteriota bacterium]|nr:MAG: hypothetical protein A2X43_01950 [Candidatus Margulisbacteria bacterium GWD2_39_127]OGI03852.1 MAG: hypothetical protein A2X42_03595 [Candidatus Margulisbacteria bacterium GWF2_38_17]OGI06411.1 MAG: hypothetical protein A2X41_06770 [Candidatus Margulisbacteria bacterium GWE2_39_32]PZM79405.1 MAG: hypothetical protein DKM50_09060 [Candidatus Margulisiibacteriota bacterium]HAR63544.1 hypothetical protein [Candidatus Margulisiibacteriota bacterium]